MSDILHFSLPGYLQCPDAAAVSLVQKYTLQIQTLSYCQAVIPLTANQPVPEGCAVAIASDRCTVNLMLKVQNQESVSSSPTAEGDEARMSLPHICLLQNISINGFS